MGLKNAVLDVISPLINGRRDNSNPFGEYTEITNSIYDDLADLGYADERPKLLKYTSDSYYMTNSIYDEE